MEALNVLGILAGNDMPIDSLAAWFHSADVTLAADGAANRLHEVGLRPTIVIGDMDSVFEHVAGEFELVTNDDQETTDCDKLLLYAKEFYPHATFAMAGIEGDRFDHVLSSLHSIAKHLPSAMLVLRDGCGLIVGPGQPVATESFPGQVVSLIPVTDCTGVSLSGVKWPPQTELSPIGATSISNQAISSEVVASVASGVALLVMQQNVLSPRWI